MFYMPKRSDLLPLTLAFITTVLIVGLGFFWINKINATKFAKVNVSSEDSELENLNTNADIEPITSETAFVMPAIVPQGTSVTINGSITMDSINQALKRNFHRQFPGTVITTEADGSNTGIDLLTSGNADLAAIERTLNKAEKAAGLVAVKIDNVTSDNRVDRELYYVYREPLNPEVEAFLGYVLSPLGQQIIVDF